MGHHTVYDGVDFETFDFPVGALVSGGVDSALMLYFLLKHHAQPLHIFTTVSEAKRYKNPMAAIGVIARCAALTGNYNFQQHIGYVRVQDGENLFELPTEFIETGRIRKVYTGITMNPPDDVVSGFKSINTEHESRNPGTVRDHHIGNYYRPWTNLDKSGIARIYEHHGLMEPLFAHTRSCEWDDEYAHGPDPGLGHCGQCWWCEERFWGFGRL